MLVSVQFLGRFFVIIIVIVPIYCKWIIIYTYNLEQYTYPWTTQDWLLAESDNCASGEAPLRSSSAGPLVIVGLYKNINL